MDAGIVATSNFTSNTATNTAGGIFVSDMAQLTDSAFIQNFARLDGGALGIQYTAKVLGHNVMFAENRAEIHGGAVALTGNASLALLHADVHGNTAQWGGGVCLTGEAHVASSVGHFATNTAEYGGAVYANRLARVLLTEQTVGVGNTATVAGGFISAEGYAQAEIFDAMFDQNFVVLDKLGSAGWGFFAVATENAVIAITNTTIEGHVSQLGVGGAMFINKNASLSLSMSMLSHYHTSAQGCHSVACPCTITARLLPMTQHWLILLQALTVVACSWVDRAKVALRFW